MEKICYIIKDHSEEVFPFIHDRFKKQNNFNSRLAFCSFCLSVCIIMMDKIIRKQNEKIETLDNEVKELKQMRGE